MPLRPPEFEVDPEDPFSRDRLGRRRRVEALCRLVMDEDSSAVVSVNGGFGTGKSVFLRMCAAHLRQEEVAVVEFNAWQQGHTGSPLVDLVSALGRDGSDIAKRLKRIARDVAWSLISAATHGVVDLSGSTEPAQASRFGEWDQAEDQISDFKDALSELAIDSDGRLVVLIDELDRCRPDYAIDTLNVARHLFDVPGVVIVMGINRTELAYRVQKIYGERCDADEYLRRFVDLPVELHDVDDQFLPGFLSDTMQSAGVGFDRASYWAEALRLLAARSEASLRDIQQAVHHVGRILPGHGTGGSAMPDLSIVAMMVLRFAAPDAYRRLATGRSDTFEAVAALRKVLKPGAENQHDVDYVLPDIEAALLRLVDSNGISPAANAEHFIGRYTDAGLGDQAQAQGALELGASEYRVPYRVTAGDLAKRIELVV